MNLKNRYGNGYECLVNTERNVTVMQQQLTDLQPILVAKGKETEEQLIIVSRETEAADKIKTSVAAEEADAQKIADEANAIKTDCEKELAEAIPALKAAEDAVNCIKKGDIAELKGIAKPHPSVVLVTSVVCMFKGVIADSKMNAETQKKEKDWWTPSVKMMMQSDFLKSLIEFDKEGI